MKMENIFSHQENHLSFLVAPDNEHIEAEVAFGWFEKSVKKKNIIN